MTMFSRVPETRCSRDLMKRQVNNRNVLGEHRGTINSQFLGN